VSSSAPGDGAGPWRSLVMRHMFGSLLTIRRPLTGAEAVFTAARPRGLNRTNHDESRERRSPARTPGGAVRTSDPLHPLPRAGPTSSSQGECLRASKWQPTAVRTGVFPGGAGPSGAKLGVLRDRHLHRSQHRLPGSVWHRHRQAKTAVRDGSRRLQRGLPGACGRFIHKGAIHGSAVGFASPAPQPTQPRVTASPDGALLLAVVLAGAPSMAPGRRSVTRCRGPPEHARRGHLLRRSCGGRWPWRGRRRRGGCRHTRPGRSRCRC
jgi:hypothetical protein